MYFPDRMNWVIYIFQLTPTCHFTYPIEFKFTLHFYYVTN